jgi:hypothetical protein
VNAVEQLHANSEGAVNLLQEVQEVDATTSSLRTELAALMGTATAEQEEEALLDDFEQQCGYALASGLLLFKLRGAVAELNAKEAATMANRKRSHAVATASSRPPAAASRSEATRSNQQPQLQRQKQRREDDPEEIDDTDSPPARPALSHAATAVKKRTRDSQDRSSAASSAARSTRQKRTTGQAGPQPTQPALPPWVTEEDDDLELEAPAQHAHSSRQQRHSQPRLSGGRGGVAPTAPVAPLSYTITSAQRPSGGSSSSSSRELTASSDRLRGGQGGSSARMAGLLRPAAEGMLFQPPPPPPASSLLPSLSRPAGMAQRTSTNFGAQGDWQPHPFAQLAELPHSGTMMDDFASTSAHHWQERWHR